MDWSPVRIYQRVDRIGNIPAGDERELHIFMTTGTQDTHVSHPVESLDILKEKLGESLDSNKILPRNGKRLKLEDSRICGI